MIRISIADQQEVHPLPFERLRTTAKAVFAGEKVTNATLSLAFVNNETIHALNKRYLDHDEPTDILTFPLSEPGARSMEGELVIGIEVAIEQAKDRGHAIDDELCLYIIHGILHLCGYDDRTPADQARMREAEAYHLAELKMPAISGD